MLNIIRTKVVFYIKYKFVIGDELTKYEQLYILNNKMLETFL